MAIESTHFKVLKPFRCKKGRSTFFAEPGKVVDVPQTAEAIRLMSLGYIVPAEIPFFRSSTKHGLMPTRIRGKRVGIWLFTSGHYSGGRIHLFQLAWALADANCEVFLITNANPRWAQDYPHKRNIHVILKGHAEIPNDLDVIITDSKGDVGLDVLAYRAKRPRVPLVAMNFETPNWVESYAPDYAKRLNLSQPNKEIFKKASVLLANSGESLKYAREWIEMPDKPGRALWPAVNTFALEKSKDPKALSNVVIPQRPYCLFSARNAEYKGFDVAVKAVWSMKKTCDLVAFGRPRSTPPKNSLHEMHNFEGQSDVVKFGMMRRALMSLAPSKFEGAGMVPMESLATGTPCVAYELPVLRELYRDRLIYVPWGDEKGFVETVAEVYRRKVGNGA